ncbi:hypothetical protein ON010_g12244 [Phytophthora cinnamomi]|nr:hypothetical protein ON010_g12244 [Phytophthora cinnamomi]
MAILFVFDMPGKLYDATFPAPEIQKVDPTFAMIDEELLVALDGKNLKPGGNVGWVAYWGCATTSSVDACEKQFVSTFEAGYVAVTFKSLDHFIPCYRDPPNPLKAQEYQCFESVRIRVKDKQSIPGWSRSAPLASSSSQPARHERSLEEELQIPTLREEKSLSSRIAGAAVTPTQRMARSAESAEAVEVDVSVTTTPSEPIDAGSNERADTDFSTADGVFQENDSFRRSAHEIEPEADSGKPAGDEMLKEVEITPDAEMKVRSVNAEPENASQNVLLEETVQEQTTGRELEQVQGPDHYGHHREESVEVGMEASKEIEDVEQAVDEENVEPYSSAIDDHEQTIHDEVKLGTTAAVVQEDEFSNAPVPDSHEVEKLEIQEEDFKMSESSDQRSIPANHYKATSAVGLEGEEEAQDSQLKPSRPEGATTPTEETPSGQFVPSTNYNKKTKSSKKRKSKRGRQAKTSLVPDAESSRAGSTANTV